MELYDKIENPKTHRYIYVNSQTFNNLIIKNKYTEEFLLSQSRIKTHIAPKSPLRKLGVTKNTNQAVPLTVPPELTTHMFSSLSIDDLISLYQVNQQWQNILNSTIVLQKLSHISNLSIVNTFFIFVKEYKEYFKTFFFTLNEISRHYHAGRGFDNNGTGDYNLDSVIASAEFGATIYDKNDKMLNLKQLKNRKTKKVNFTVYYDNNFLKTKVKMIVPYRTVVLKLGGKWYIKPKEEWYNNCEEYENNLPNLNTRKFIVVNNPFEQVTISEDLKGSPLTIDDILFATRALAMDEWRTINIGYNQGDYKILSNTLTTLTLQPTIDNFST